MVNKVKTAQEALENLREGAVIMVGGFAGAGSPNALCAFGGDGLPKFDGDQL